MRKTILAGLVLLGGCVTQSGPVIGDWRGREQAIEGYHDRVTEIILDGTPRDSTGIYHLVSMVPSSELIDNTRDVHWSDHWTRSVLRDPSGAPYTVYHLDNPPPGHQSDYILLSSGDLLPTLHPGHPDISPAALRIRLAPLPRTAYGYGRP